MKKIFFIASLFFFTFSGVLKAQNSSETLSSTKRFNRGSRNFSLEQGTASSGWKHIYDRHINLNRFTSKSKFDSSLTESQIIHGLRKILKHGKETSYQGLPVFEYRMKIKDKYKKYRATVNKNGTVRTFHPLN